MIDLTVPAFPAIAVDVIHDRLALLDAGTPKTMVLNMRPLRANDSNISVGIFARQWANQDTSYELLGSPGSGSGTLQRYGITVQAMVRDADEERGLAQHSVLAKLVRAALDRDQPFRLGFSQLVSNVGGSRESMGRFGVETQRFRSVEVRGAFIHLASLDFWFETQTE